MRSYLITCATSLILSMASVAAAQTTGTITGTVHDPNGGVLPGASVTARHVDTGANRTVVADEQGRFVVAALPVGAYELRAELAGFKPLVHTGIHLTVGETAVVRLSMAVGNVTEEITVRADANRVNTSSAELSYLVGEDAIEQLPLNGRNYTDLALLQPGVNAFPHRDGGSVVAHGLAMSVNGQDPRSNVYLLDGTLQNDFTNGPAGSAAGTALGMETIREFRVEANAYSAEFGRNSGGQINVLTKSGTNQFRGSAFEFHRNDSMDARNYFDPADKPDFVRNQFGGALGGPFRRDRSFFFFGYEALRENLGRTISTFVPDDNARHGVLPDPTNPGGTITVDINPAVRPYLDAFPRANGPVIGGGIAGYAFDFEQELTQNFAQARVDHHAGPNHQLFARYTYDGAEQRLPTDYPQFPRSFVSRNQFFTGEYRQILSSRTLHTARFGFSRTRIGQAVEANVTGLQPFVPGRPFVGNIDIGGLKRFGPQTSAGVQLAQNVFSFQDDVTYTRGRHLLKAGALAERYVDDMTNPTFSLGIYAFSNLRTFLLGQPLRFVGLTPEGDIERNWRFTLFGVYLQDDFQVAPRLTVNAGLRYEFSTLPRDTGGRDSALPDLLDRAPTVGDLYRNPTHTNVSPRVGAAWNLTGDGRTSLRAGYGLYFNTNNHQNLIVTVTNPPATPRVVLAAPAFPTPSFNTLTGLSIRPIQFDLDNPRVHVWNVSVQRELWADTVATIGYAGSRGLHLLRSGDVNIPTPDRQSDGTLFFPMGRLRPNTAFTTIELKSSDGDSWYRALIVDVRRRWKNGLTAQSSYTFSRSEDTTQASTFFSDATNGTTSAFPEFIPDYNNGLSDFHAAHNWVMNATWELPFARGLTGVGKSLLDGWRVSAIANVRSGNPLTAFVQANRSRSQWAPSIGPGIGLDRPSYAPGRGPDNALVGDPNSWFDPSAFVLQPAGTFGNTGRGDFIGPNLRTVDLAFAKTARWSKLGDAGSLEFRVEIFNLFNRVNFGPPALIAFAGDPADTGTPLSTFGRISSTVTSARQMQLGLRVAF